MDVWWMNFVSHVNKRSHFAIETPQNLRDIITRRSTFEKGFFHVDVLCEPCYLFVVMFYEKKNTETTMAILHIIGGIVI